MLVTRLRACLSVMARHDCTRVDEKHELVQGEAVLVDGVFDGLRWYVFTVDVERAQHLDVGRCSSARR